MTKDNIRFGVILAASLLLSALAISLFLKVLKVAIFVILVLALAPVVYFILQLILRLLLPGSKRKSDKLKMRD